NKVDYPIAVDPDERLRAVAKGSDWPIISLRDEECPTAHFHK
ncbi:MAG: HAD-IB family hydrolase, partial [Methylococcaceae bacterium]|nr:HAD-IB family hydrolase [Methylococcaceae bacterium]